MELVENMSSGCMFPIPSATASSAFDVFEALPPFPFAFYCTFVPENWFLIADVDFFVLFLRD